MNWNLGGLLSPRYARLLALIGVVALAGCGGSSGNNVAKTLLRCDDSMKSEFKPDADTSVLLVKSFKKGDPLLLTGAATPATPTAQNDLCMVKLLVGPGNPGPAGAPSTSAGIGIEVWLPAPANWNHRLHVTGGGGWAGDDSGSTTSISVGAASNDLMSPAMIAGIEGAVSATTDTGHQGGAFNGSFAMNPDGTVNTTLWADFASRGIHEMAVKSKELAQAYYGSAPRYSYWDGASTGGRQGLKEAQVNPQDFDGIIAAMPAINWSKFITAELYPQIVFQQDLAGVPLSTAQQDLVSNAAINACDVVNGVHLGYIMDPAQCKYDPTNDPGVLCVASGGANTSSACVTTAQAQAMNKIWYGMTADGSVPSPASDVGWGISPSGRQLWYGLARGTNTHSVFGLPLLASPVQPFPIAMHQVALELQDSTIADPTFINARGNGANGWRSLTYGQLANAFDRGIALQSSFGNIDTDNPDLSAFMNRGGKMIMYHGMNDEAIFPQGSINYYNRVISQMGSLATVQNFYRFYLVPGMGHGTPNGTANPTAKPPIPAPGQIYQLLTAWVEQGVAPDRVELSNPDKSISQPICPYPKKAVYQSGDPHVAASYICG
jgi:feruloyl esterase